MKMFRGNTLFWLGLLAMLATGCSDSGVAGSSARGEGDVSAGDALLDQADISEGGVARGGSKPGSGTTTVAIPDMDATTTIWDGGGGKTPDASEGEGDSCLEFEAECSSNEECCSGFCLEGEEGFKCSQLCAENCPEGYECKAVLNSYPDVVTICVPIVDTLCKACVNDSQCNAGQCIEIGSEKYCTEDCSLNPCPENFSCVEDEDGSQRCLPDNGTCDCNPSTDGDIRPCSKSSDVGICSGFQTCELEDGWTECDANEPVEEVCNGLDDDCNGIPDEGLPSSQSCMSENEFGMCEGEAFCQGGQGWVCEAQTPAEELCDFQDNDCDGEVDEIFKNEVGKYATLNHCGGCGKDCEGLFPNAVAFCNDSGMVPFCAVQECEPGFYKEGDFQCLPFENNACQPCVADFQCSGGKCVELDGASVCAQLCEEATCGDGFICLAGVDSEGVAKGQVCLPKTGACDCVIGDEGKKRPCTSVNDIGTCLGYETCDPNVGWGECDALVPSLEVCNGIDDDCTGYVDDGLPAVQSCENETDAGVCSGEATCLGPQGWVCNADEPVAELCDYQDNDCDVDIDENYKNEAGKYALQNHCGACNISCDEAIQNGSAFCDASGVTPICVVDECDPGYYPLNDFICLPQGENLCKACVGDEQCEGNICIDIGEGSYCSQACETDEQCPEGYGCEESELGSFCIPANGTCDCNADTEGAKKICEVSNELGVCFGYEECVLETGWGDCTALPPATETCDGVDNDCNGFVDDALPLTQPCAEENTFGVCEGAATCSGTQGWVCDANIPGAETCDYLDNDCDTSIDEDFKNESGQYAVLEHCGSCNNTCVGAIPNGTAYCDSTGVTPVCKVEECAPGYYALNDFICLPEGDSDCKPCQNSTQCDGLTCVGIGDSTYCSATCAGDGDCPGGYGCEALAEGNFCVPANGTCDCTVDSAGAKKLCEAGNALGLCFGYEECVPETGWSSCSAEPPAPEVCDGVDNDCNGFVDDALPATQACTVANELGTCAGTETCAGPNGWVCDAAQPSEDICDYLDNDCDGDADEDFVDASGKYTTLEHCGACGNTCLGAIQNATAFCDSTEVTPICKVESCEDGYYALNEFICLPEGDTDCKPCQDSSQCDGLSCVEIGDGTYCASTCENDGDCPDGYGCQVSDAGQVCVPANGTCDCTEETAGGKKLCQVDNDLGTCFGFEECVPSDGWTACSALAPDVETCDGVDNDCNGFVDDGLPDSQPCDVTNEFGVCEGVALCLGSQGWVCDAETPSAEICDYQDNNCDGNVDEAFTNADGKYGSEVHCGGCNSPCGETIENALVEVCDASLAAPTCIALECIEGFFPTTPFQCVEVPDVNCFPCTSDDDCFGGVCAELEDGSRCLDACEDDDSCEFGFQCVAGACEPVSGACSCVPDTAGTKKPCSSENSVGECLGFQTCDPFVGWSACDAPTPAEEVCNGLDDDCNGIPDDGLPPTIDCEESNSVGTCLGEAVCQGGAGWICDAAVPAEETCDFQDNDCDGGVDEDFKNSDGKYDTYENCGTCGKECGNTVANAVTEICDSTEVVPQCEATECAPGYFLQSELQCTQIPAISCSPCLDDSTCFGGTCVTFPEGGFCLKNCDDDSACDSGYACDDGVCQPENGTCDCTEATDGAQRACQVSNELGTCIGFETCDPAQGWSGCTAAEPAEEDCDGADNDCNGLIDDGLPAQQVCAKKNAFGECAGFAKCYGAAGWVCLADTPEAEVCDFQDNNCDGEVDEDFVDETGKYASEEHCGTCNNPCGDVFPNSLLEVCDTASAVPQCIIDTCEEGYLKLTEFQCLEIPDVACAPCASDANCFGSTCSSLDGGNFCLDDCDEGQCADGYFCSGGLCLPDTGTCTCTPENDGSKRSCFAENELGICYGFETCDADLGWGSCDAELASIEVCNGEDDDCNGFVDDGLPATQPCDNTNGFGSCAGNAVCYGTLGWFCQAPQAEAETCDYLDNDCDGLTDEDFKIAGDVYGSPDHCGECNKTCEGSILNGEAYCDTTAPIPQCVVEECVDGWEKFNEFLCIPVTSTLCEPCVTEEQCLVDGATCLALNDGNFCSVPCSELEDCPSGYSCQPVEGVESNQCVPNTSACTCDGTNLDLQLACEVSYEQPGTGATTTCFGTTYCTEDGWGFCELPDEICNYLDENCDGVADETFKNEQGQYDSDEHCGQCNANCSTLSYENGFSVCSSAGGGTPECVLVCEPGFSDVNENPADGCECNFVSATDLPDGVDTNCDGVDGEVDNAYFVSKDGSDTATGAIDDPFFTVNHALNQAKANGKRDVYVATGVYSENIALAEGISMYGGYSADFSVHDSIIYETALLGSIPGPGELPGTVSCDGIQGGNEPTRIDGFLIFGYDALSLGDTVYAVYLRNCTDVVELTSNKIVAGNGGNGIGASPGQDGANGVDGGNGPNGGDIGNCSFGGQFSNGGNGGNRTCGNTNVSGGDGGDGMCPDYQASGQLANESGSAGQNGGGAGGEVGYDRLISSSSGGGGGSCVGNCGGNAGGCWCDSLCLSVGDCCPDYVAVCISGGGGGGSSGSCSLGAGSCSLCLVAQDGKKDVGQPGQNGLAGNSGSSGAGCGNPAGQVVGGLWIAGTGGSGSAGADGRGGGGGGAGGGVETCSCGGDDIGGGGGGGGSGGCGGTGGTGATGGGGSFAVFVYFSATPSSVPFMEGNEIKRGFGGTGGSGGNGGVGGLPGFGGDGGVDGSSDPDAWCSQPGGTGGDGGSGGQGGGGGGGCGGASFGIYVSGQGNQALNPWKTGNAFNAGGSGGQGGVGGLSLGNSGLTGADGIFAETNF